MNSAPRAGGPVRKNKTFFFADYQGIRLRQPRTITSTIPTLAQRSMMVTRRLQRARRAGIRSDNGASRAGGAIIRDQFPGNRIPANRLDPAAIKLFGLLPTPTSPAATRNFIFNPTLSQRTDQFDARVDQNVGTSDRLFFKYSFDDTALIQPGTAALARQCAGCRSGNLTFVGGRHQFCDRRCRCATSRCTFNYTKVFGPAHWSMKRGSAWCAGISTFCRSGIAFNTATAIGIPGININDKSGGLPALTVTGFQVIGDNSTYPEQSQTTSFQYEDILTKIHGSHTFKFGARFVRHRFNGFSAFPTRGQYTISTASSRARSARAGAQTALADFALGATDGVTRNVLQGTFGMRVWKPRAFAEDSWRITNRFTFQYGLRYEIFAPPYDVHDHWSNFNVVTGQLLMAGKNGNSRRLRNFDMNNFGPRDRA